MKKPLWRPTEDQIKKANLMAFMSFINQRHNTQIEDYFTLYDWSVRRKEFWSDLWDFCGVQGEKNDPISEGDGTILGTTWFPNAKLNYAQNLLKRRDEETALIFWGENKIKRRLSFNDLYNETSRLVEWFQEQKLRSKDRVAAFLPNIPESVIGVLGTTALGAIWSSCSPDFGLTGIMDRFGQIQPKILIAVEAYTYNGKIIDCAPKILDLLDSLPSIEKVLIVSYLDHEKSLSALETHPKVAFWSKDVSLRMGKEIQFELFPFNQPLYILYSSGTTGAPKCIVHGAGGTLLQHLKEHQLHADLKKNDRLFYFTTCGWMMWNWLVSGLASEATLLLYDGSPFYPKGTILFDYAAQEKMTHFGTSAKYIDSLKKINLKPKDNFDLSSLRMITSTGSPLVPESFEYVYESIKEDVCLSSISGGTDIVSCFALGCPILPVYRGELQVRGLGMAVEVFDENGNSVHEQKGELVCTKPFPARPLYFWNDPDNQKFKSAYFERFEGYWAHGDYVELTKHQGMVFYGRSDAVLNPGGVRIGTAEIYRQVEQVDEVLESIAVGQDWQGDVRVILFVKLKENISLDQGIIDKIKTQIKIHASPRHVPAKIIQIPDIPRTKSGKIVELAVRDVIHGKEVKNREALANPEALDLFKDIKELQT